LLSLLPHTFTPGAPLIAMVACLGLSVDLNTNVSTIGELDGIDANDSQTLLSFIHEKMDYLATSRPTAVNLFNAMKELKLVLEEASTGSDGTVRERLCQAVNRHAEFMLRRDVADNEAIGAFGAAAILRHTTQSSARVVTICNTGSLATAGYGTALGVVRALHAQGKLESIHALETRPYNQGSRLTAFEIMEEQMPNGTLICDSAAGALMKLKGVDACVVGADRVCANGDTANKIGTYNLSLVAAAHGVPFYIAAPFTTLDVSLKTGDEIEIEERPAAEMIVSGNAPANMPCWNPAFDVTPAKYIAGIITEKGVIEPNIDGTIDVAAFV
jgi:S-methyl-5-thioribose-1-phosphate isomerase